MEKPLPDDVEECMIEVKVDSLHTLQLHPGDWWNPLGDTDGEGIKKGLLVRIEDRGASFLLAKMRDSLGNIFDERGHPLMTG